MDKKRLQELAGIQLNEQADNQYTEAAKKYAKWRSIEAETFEEPKEFDYFIKQYADMFKNLATKPVQQAFNEAEKKYDILYKDYRNLLEFLLAD